MQHCFNEKNDILLKQTKIIMKRKSDIYLLP